MDNAQKAIMIGVGLFITIIVIAAVMLITGIGQDLLNSGTQKASSISDNLQASLTSQYDGTTLTGSQVISAIKSNYKTEGLVIMVNGKNYGMSVIKGSVDNVTGVEKIKTLVAYKLDHYLIQVQMNILIQQKIWC